MQTARHVTDTAPPPPLAPLPSAPSRRWPLYGVLLGVGLGVADTLLLMAAGVHMTAGSRDVLVPVSAFFTVSYGAFGWIVGHLLVARRKLRQDGAIIRQQLDELERRRRELVQAEKLASLGRMAAGVAHEVRNPLGVMRSSAALLLEGMRADDADARKLCGFIGDEVDRLDAFVGAILDYARPMQLRDEPVDLGEVTRTAHALAAEHLGERTLRVDGEASTRGDPDLLVQLVLGLLVNAAEATSATGSITVSIGGGDNGAWLEVDDDGPGVDAAQAAQIFEPFFTTKARGTGLGLAMAARVAEAHGGLLRHVTGARFRLELIAA